jgi:hypothetical protein
MRHNVPDLRLHPLILHKHRLLVAHSEYLYEPMILFIFLADLLPYLSNTRRFRESDNSYHRKCRHPPRVPFRIQTSIYRGLILIQTWPRCPPTIKLA